MTTGTNRLLDAYLVLAAKAGDRTVGEQIARRWHRKLIAHAWRLTGDAEAARDAAQAGWSEILAGLDRLRDEHAFPAWAFRIVSRACTRQIGQTVRQRRLADALAAEPVEAAQTAPDGDEEVQRLRAAIRALSPGHRAAIALFHFEELSVAEVAVALNIPLGTAKTRLMHARRKLRLILEGNEDAQH